MLVSQSFWNELPVDVLNVLCRPSTFSFGILSFRHLLLPLQPRLHKVIPTAKLHSATTSRLCKSPTAFDLLDVVAIGSLPEPAKDPGVAAASPVVAANPVVLGLPSVVVASPITKTVALPIVVILMGVPSRVTGRPGASVCDPMMYCVMPSSTVVMTPESRDVARSWTGDARVVVESPAIRTVAPAASVVRATMVPETVTDWPTARVEEATTK
jgi:hypothetical protein